MLMPGHLLLYHPGVRKLKELVEAGELGDVLYLYGNRQNFGKIRREENALSSLGAHDLSVILHLVGEEPTEVLGARRALPRRGRGRRLLLPALPLREGRAHAPVLARPAQEARDDGRRHETMVVFDDMELERKITVYDKATERPPESYGEWRTRTGDIYCPKIPNDEPLRLEVQHFLDLVAGQRRPARGRRATARRRARRSSSCRLARSRRPRDHDRGDGGRLPGDGPRRGLP